MEIVTCIAFLPLFFRSSSPAPSLTAVMATLFWTECPKCVCVPEHPKCNACEAPAHAPCLLCMHAPPHISLMHANAAPHNAPPSCMHPIHLACAPPLYMCTWPPAHALQRPHGQLASGRCARMHYGTELGRWLACPEWVLRAAGSPSRHCHIKRESTPAERQGVLGLQILSVIGSPG